GLVQTDTFRQRSSEPDRRRSGADRIGAGKGYAHLREGFQNGPDSDEDDHRPGFEIAHAGPEWLVLDEHFGKSGRRGTRRSGLIQNEGRKQAVRAGSDFATGALSGSVQRFHAQSADPLLSSARG